MIHFVTEFEDLDVDPSKLKKTFGSRNTASRGPVASSPRSCDSASLLWSCMKSLTYEAEPETINAMEKHIRRVVRCQLQKKLAENWNWNWEIVFKI